MKNSDLAYHVSNNGRENLLKLYNQKHLWKILIEKKILNFHNAVL